MSKNAIRVNRFFFQLIITIIMFAVIYSKWICANVIRATK